MGTITRRKLPDLIEDFLEKAPQYEFFQAIRVLEELWYGHGKVGDGLDEWLRMRPAAEISFPAADIRRCEFADDGKLDMQLNFMGLYGVDAPVPHYFTEFIAREHEISEPMRAFLDIFCQRMYAQFYLAWKKYRPHVHLEQADSAYISYLSALSGNAVTPQDGCELGFSGSLGTRVRSATALSGMLSEYMNDTPVQVAQFVPRWVRLEQESFLGAEGDAALCLGDNTILGDAVLDVSGKIDVCIGPMDADEARSLLPGKQRALDLGHLIERFLDPTLTFDVVLKVQPSNVVAQRLGEDDVVLGWSSWVGSKINENYELRIPGSNFFIKPAPNSEQPELSSTDMQMVA